MRLVPPPSSESRPAPRQQHVRPAPCDRRNIAVHGLPRGVIALPEAVPVVPRTVQPIHRALAAVHL